MKGLVAAILILVTPPLAMAAHGGGFHGGGFHGGGFHGGGFHGGGFHGGGFHGGGFHGGGFRGGFFFGPFWYPYAYGYPYAFGYPYAYPYAYPYPEYYPPEYYPPTSPYSGSAPPPESPYAGQGEQGPSAEATPEDARRADYGLVSLHGVLDGAAVDLDGRFWLTAEALEQRWLALPRGAHTLTVHVSGARPIERRIQVRAGATQVVRFAKTAG